MTPGKFTGDTLMYFEERGAPHCVGDCDCVSEKSKVWIDALTMPMNTPPPVVTFDGTSGYYTVDLKGISAAQWKWRFTGGNAATLELRADHAPSSIKHVRLNPKVANRDLPFSGAFDKGTMWIYLPPSSGGVHALDEIQLVP